MQQILPNIICKKVRPVWQLILSNLLSISNTLTHISKHFFTHTYIKNTQTTLLKLLYQTPSEIPVYSYYAHDFLPSFTHSSNGPKLDFCTLKSLNNGTDYSVIIFIYIYIYICMYVCMYVCVHITIFNMIYSMNMINWVQLIYAFRIHINHLFLETFYEKLKNLSKEMITFSFFHKKFSKIVY